MSKSDQNKTCRFFALSTTFLYRTFHEKVILSRKPKKLIFTSYVNPSIRLVGSLCFLHPPKAPSTSSVLKVWMLIIFLFSLKSAKKPGLHGIYSSYLNQGIIFSECTQTYDLSCTKGNGVCDAARSRLWYELQES